MCFIDRSLPLDLIVVPIDRRGIDEGMKGWRDGLRDKKDDGWRDKRDK
jgi:hypothetical protein